MICVFLTVFAILFYIDNKHRFVVNIDTKIRRENRIESVKLKWLLVKLGSTLSVAQIEYNTVKSYLHFWLLNKGCEPFIASMIASSITIVGYVAIVDIMPISHDYSKNNQ